MRSDQPEFDEWFRAHHAAVYRFAYRRVGSDQVEDVVAETFLAAWRRSGDMTGDPLPWLLGIARRVCANHLRGHSRRLALFDRLARERTWPSADAFRTDQDLGEALMSLSDSDREALLLVAWDGLSHGTAAALLGISPSAFGVRVHRAKARLARALSDDDGLSPDNDHIKEFTRDVL